MKDKSFNIIYELSSKYEMTIREKELSLAFFRMRKCHNPTKFQFKIALVMTYFVLLNFKNYFQVVGVDFFIL